MNNSEVFAHDGIMHFQLLDAETLELVFDVEQHNMLMSYVRSRYLKGLAGQFGGLAIDDMNIRYIAFGDGTAEPTQADVKLANERYRQQVTSKSLQADRLVTMVSVSPFVTAANFRIREVGIFSGSGASQTRNSGTLISRILVDIDKNSNTILNVHRTDLITI